MSVGVLSWSTPYWPSHRSASSGSLRLTPHHGSAQPWNTLGALAMRAATDGGGVNEDGDGR